MNISTIRNLFKSGETATVCGRVKFIRTISKKLTFIVIFDQDASIQIGIRSTNVPGKLDIVKVTGLMSPSNTGELTIWDENPVIIAKNEGDIPCFEGITDPDLCRRKKYLHMLTNQEALNNILFRTKVIRHIRTFLDELGYVEVETPILSGVASGANAVPFKTVSEATNETFYLRIAQEIALKKALIGGLERVYEIGKNFRNEGIDKTHNPEFTSIELYQSFAGLSDMRDILINILNAFGVKTFDIYEYDELYAKFGEDFDKQLINPTFVYGHPADDAPLCKLRDDGKCDRFEFFMNGFEIANAYNEQNDWRIQEQRLAGKADDGLIEALKYGMPPTGGMGIGIDRLVMALKNITDIRDVILFTTKRN